MRLKKIIFLKISLFGIAVSPFVACSSYNTSVVELREAWTQGKYEDAENIVLKEIEEDREDNQLLWRMEYASILKKKGAYEESIRELKKADEIIADWESKPDIKIVDEAFASINNLTDLPYRGEDYEKIMLSTYLALNYLKIGDFNSARVALNKAYSRQVDAVEKNAKEIEEAKKEQNDKKLSQTFNIDKAFKSKEFKNNSAGNINELGITDVYSDYVNPFSTWLYGLYFLYNALDNADLQKSRNALKKVVAMLPQNKMIKTDYELCESLISGEKLNSNEKIVYVIYEMGICPERIENRIDFPIITNRGAFHFLSIALPYLKKGTVFLSDLYVQQKSKPAVKTELICNMNSVIYKNLNNKMPIIMLRSFTTAAFKLAFQIAATEIAGRATKNDNPNGNLVVIAVALVGAIIAHETTEADLRQWQTLPAGFSATKLILPKSEKSNVENLEIALLNHKKYIVSIPDYSVSIVYVESTNPNIASKITIFSLKK